MICIDSRITLLLLERENSQSLYGYHLSQAILNMRITETLYLLQEFVRIGIMYLEAQDCKIDIRAFKEVRVL